MKILMSVAMSNTKKVAESFLTQQLPQVFDNLAKIYTFRVSAETHQEWTDEIADKHISAIRRCVNNVVTKKGHLSSDIIIKVWNEVVKDSFLSSLRKVGRDPKYKNLVKVGRSYADDEAAIKSLLASDEWFARSILINRLEQDDVIALHLAMLLSPSIE